MQGKGRVDKNILVINVVVVMSAIEPFRNICDFGKNQRRADGIERLCLVEGCRGSAAEAHNVGEKLSRSALSQEPLLNLRCVALN